MPHSWTRSSYTKRTAAIEGATCTSKARLYTCMLPIVSQRKVAQSSIRERASLHQVTLHDAALSGKRGSGLCGPHLHERAHGAMPEGSYAFLFDHLICAVPDTVVLDREALPALHLYTWTPGTEECYSCSCQANHPH